ncbi:creatininase family protein [Paenibacillus thalictri]|uniref:Creatininase family protein n=1 Tax=Paenibacillus thalictri TaxID=2527873 RepID=A0A4Q9DWL7_9BACL|nr:creatininase family protein [Paenibacillus thalictri]TBL79561.1 creatininase family protein [Paenibacillus thalictri]
MFQRYEGIAWEQRFLPRLSYKQIEELPKENALVVLPVGAVEQHGSHLPVMTDSLIGEALLTQALERLERSAQVWVIPPVSYGKSNEHIGFAGTIALSSLTLQHVIMDIAQSLHLSGFRRLLLFNSHGGNQDLLNLVAREIRIATGMTVFYMMPHSLDSLSDLLTEEEVAYGIHGGDSETSIVKAVKPHWVRDELAVRDIPSTAAYEFLTLEGGIRFAWKMSDISASGVAGDATLATAEKGQIIIDRLCGILSRALVELCSFTISDMQRPAPQPPVKL